MVLDLMAGFFDSSDSDKSYKPVAEYRSQRRCRAICRLARWMTDGRVGGG